MFSLYLFDSDNGSLVKIIRDLDLKLAKCMASEYHFSDGYDVKMVDQSDGVVVYTLGI